MLGWAELCCGLDFPRGVASVGKRPCPSRVCDCAAGGNRLAFWPEFSREAPSFTIVENTVVENAVPWLAARGPDPFPISSLPLTGLSVGERTGSRILQWVWSYVLERRGVWPHIVDAGHRHGVM